MNNFNDIICRFDDIQDLPVSEELLGAFLEDKLDAYDSLCVKSAIEGTPVLQDLLEEIDSPADIPSVEYGDSDVDSIIPLADMEAADAIFSCADLEVQEQIFSPEEFEHESHITPDESTFDHGDLTFGDITE